MLKAASDNEEGRLVAHSIFEEKMNHHLSYNDFAILYRTNAQSRSMEEALRKLNIKYKIIGRRELLPAQGDKRPDRVPAPDRQPQR